MIKLIKEIKLFFIILVQERGDKLKDKSPSIDDKNQ